MASNPQRDRSQEVTPDLVRKVAERVYALLLADLKRQRERSRREKPGGR